MKDPDVDPGFSWPLALFITGLCFLAFFYILAKLNENTPRVFLWIGVAGLAMGLLTMLASFFVSQRERRGSE